MKFCDLCTLYNTNQARRHDKDKLINLQRKHFIGFIKDILVWQYEYLIFLNRLWDTIQSE